MASRATSRQTYLLRPDLGRSLDAASRDRLIALTCGSVDLAFVIGDGLSSSAVHAHAVGMVRPSVRGDEERREPGTGHGRLPCPRRARDEIGALLRARLVVMLIGERPGLSSPRQPRL